MHLSHLRTSISTLLLAPVLASIAWAQQNVQQPFSLDSFRGAAGDITTSQRIELPLASSAGVNARVRSVESRIAAHSAQYRGAAGFTTLTHEEFPQVSVRIRQHAGMPASQTSNKHDSLDPEAWCDPTVTSWTGYIDTIDGKSLWFQAFESRSNPAKDPLLLWTNGGPGGSSALGLFQELGPCQIPARNGTMPPGPPINGTVFNPHSWNSQASIIFIDQPVGVGFSYTRYGVHTYDADQGAKDVYAFLRIFLSALPKFADNDFVMTAESYGGRYIPRYAAEVVDQNAAIVHHAARKGVPVDKSRLINLKAAAIGNGLFSPSVQWATAFDMLCTRKGGSKTPLLPILTCKRMEVWKKRCDELLPKICLDTRPSDECNTQSETCMQELLVPFDTTGMNPYNIEEVCAGGPDDLCYPATADVRAYLDRKDVRELIGAATIEQIGPFHSSSEDVHEGFVKNGDMSVDSVGFVSGLLERGIKVFIYVGTLDLLCNWLGNREWVFNMEWTGRERFLAAKNYEWLVDGKPAGETQSAAGLTWATIYKAGHLVPFDKPREAKEMINRWLRGDSL